VIDPAGRRLSLFLLAATCLSFALAACGSQTSHAAAPTPTAVTTNDPGLVTLRYNRTFFSGHFHSSLQYLLPEERSFLNDVQKGMNPDTVRESHLRVGSVSRSGQTAEVTLTGTICLTGRHGRPVSKDPKACDTNTDPTSKRPGWNWRLDLYRGQWYVGGVTKQPPDTGKSRFATVSPSP
jgi:hypothetical protein